MTWVVLLSTMMRLMMRTCLFLFGGEVCMFSQVLGACLVACCVDC